MIVCLSALSRPTTTTAAAAGNVILRPHVEAWLIAAWLSKRDEDDDDEGGGEDDADRGSASSPAAHCHVKPLDAGCYLC